jgi:hypothetical protein
MVLLVEKYTETLDLDKWIAQAKACMGDSIFVRVLYRGPSVMAQ